MDMKISICAHPAIEQELRDQWPDGNFFFHKEGNEFRGILQDYDDGKCSVLVGVGKIPLQTLLYSICTVIGI